VIARAKEVLALLEGDGAQLAARLTADGLATPVGARSRAPRIKRTPQEQLGFFGETVRVEVRNDPAVQALVDRVAAVDPDRLTPIDALQLLATLRAQARGTA
jgi:DNA mismatch repair protein MutS